MARAAEVSRSAPVSALDRGFSGLYNLDFAGAQRDFAAWQQLHPDDPVGPVSEAAGFLLCAEHVRQLGGASPLPNLMEVKG
jgi:hypothetical protein